MKQCILACFFENKLFVLQFFVSCQFDVDFGCSIMFAIESFHQSASDRLDEFFDRVWTATEILDVRFLEVCAENQLVYRGKLSQVFNKQYDFQFLLRQMIAELKKNKDKRIADLDQALNALSL